MTQARVLYELGTRSGATGSEIGQSLDLDPGYLSRILRDAFAAAGSSRARVPATTHVVCGGR